MIFDLLAYLVGMVRFAFEYESLWHQLLKDVGSVIHGAGKLLVLLRDGRKLMGTLRSFDQFGIHSSSLILVHLWYC